MSKSTTAQIKSLLDHHDKDISIHNFTILSSKDVFSLKLDFLNKQSFKAYARFPEIRLPKHSFFYTLLKKAGDFSKENRQKRQFEFYIYNTSQEFLPGLYHYYIKNNSLEKLPILDPFDEKKILIDRTKEKHKMLLIITLSLTSLPKNNQHWWYRNNVIELGRLTETIMLLTQGEGHRCKIYEFLDTKLNTFLNINQYKESAVQCIVF